MHFFSVDIPFRFSWGSLDFSSWQFECAPPVFRSTHLHCQHQLISIRYLHLPLPLILPCACLSGEICLSFSGLFALTELLKMKESGDAVKDKRIPCMDYIILLYSIYTMYPTMHTWIWIESRCNMHMLMHQDVILYSGKQVWCYIVGSKKSLNQNHWIYIPKDECLKQRKKIQKR